MSKVEGGGVASAEVMRALLEHQQQNAKDITELRDATHETGLALMETGQIFKGLARSQEDLEDTVQWVNLGMNLVSLYGAAQGVGSAASAGPNAQFPEVKDYDAKSFSAAMDYAKTLQEAVKIESKRADEESTRASEEIKEDANRTLNVADELVEARDAEQALTRQFMDTMNPRHKQFQG